MVEKLEQAVNEYIQDFVGICELSKKYKIPNKKIREALEDLGYNLGKGVSPKSVINIKRAVDEYIQILESGLEPNINSLSKKYEVAHTSISTTLKKKDVHVVRYPKIIQFDEHIFDNIDTEEKAYWLGFLHADGYITSRYNTVGVCLAEKDLNHVQKYAQFLGCPENVHKKESNEFIAYRCDIGNSYLKQLLVEKYNFTTTKSYDLCFPDMSIFDEPSFIRDYIRGYCDGDGSLCFAKVISKITNKITLRPIVNFVGTLEMLTSIRDYLLIPKTILQQKSKNNKLFSLTYSNRQAKQIADFLYENANTYLERKYQKYLDFCRHYKEL